MFKFWRDGAFCNVYMPVVLAAFGPECAEAIGRVGPLRTSVPYHRQFGDAVTVEVGWKNLQPNPAHYALSTDPDIPEPVGGTVVEQLDYRELDPETGEIHARTVYRCLDSAPPMATPRRHPKSAPSKDSDRNACWAGMRWLYPPDQPRKRRGRPTRDEIDAVRYAWTLLKASL